MFVQPSSQIKVAPVDVGLVALAAEHALRMSIHSHIHSTARHSTELRQRHSTQSQHNHSTRHSIPTRTHHRPSTGTAQVQSQHLRGCSDLHALDVASGEVGPPDRFRLFVGHVLRRKVQVDGGLVGVGGLGKRDGNVAMWQCGNVAMWQCGKGDESLMSRAWWVQ